MGHLFWALYHIMPCYHSTLALLLLLPRVLGVTINLVLLMDLRPIPHYMTAIPRWSYLLFLGLVWRHRTLCNGQVYYVIDSICTWLGGLHQ